MCHFGALFNLALKALGKRQTQERVPLPFPVAAWRQVCPGNWSAMNRDSSTREDGLSQATDKLPEPPQSPVYSSKDLLISSKRTAPAFPPRGQNISPQLSSHPWVVTLLFPHQQLITWFFSQAPAKCHNSEATMECLSSLSLGAFSFSPRPSAKSSTGRIGLYTAWVHTLGSPPSELQ